MDTDDTVYNLKWKNYERHLVSVMERMLDSESFADVTLVCGEPDSTLATTIKAHKILLGASSPYFELVFSSHPCQHPVIILPPGIRPLHLHHVLNFIYRGEVQVPQDELAGVLNCAGQLRVRGLEPDTVLAPPKDFLFTPKHEGSRESSVEPDRPASQQSGAGKRKSCPKFHFLKNDRRQQRRKLPLPVRAGTPDDVRDLGTPEDNLANADSTLENGGVQATSNSLPPFCSEQENVKTIWDSQRNPLFDPSSDADRGDQGPDDTQQQGPDDTHQDDQLIISPHHHRLLEPLTSLTTHNLSPRDQEDDDVPDADGPVDFTIKSELSSGSPVPGVCTPPPPDLTNLKVQAFLAAAACASPFGVNHQQQQDNVDCMPVGYGGKRIPAQYNSKNYTKQDMALALAALKNNKLTLSRASEMYGIPPTTLWQRANRNGIPTPKKDTANKTWSEEDLNSALEMLRQKKISANKAAKVYKIPSSTLYKIARKEGIELAQPFNAVATAWSQDDLNLALEAIKGGMAVQKAAAEYGIPSGTLYGRCKKVGIELSKATQVQWSEDDMVSALEVVRTGNMSINQAAIHFNLPYSSLYGRINRLKREQASEWEDVYEDHSNGIEMRSYMNSEDTLETSSMTTQQPAPTQQNSSQTLPSN